MNIQDIERIARFSLEFDNRPDFLREIERKQLESNNQTGSIPYCNFIYLLTILQETHAAVDIGTLHGVSAAHMCKAGHIITIDPDPHAGDYLYLIENSCDMRQICSNSLDWQPKDWYPIQLLFLDSVHTNEHCSKELAHFRPYAIKGGIVLIDDIHISYDMDCFWSQIPDPKVDLSFLHNTGFGACIIE